MGHFSHQLAPPPPTPQSLSSQQELEVISLIWAGRFFQLPVVMETFLKAAIWELAEAARSLVALLLSQGY